MSSTSYTQIKDNNTISEKQQNFVSDLVSKMTLEEKIGQMSQLSSFEGSLPDDLKETIRKGLTGSIINEVDLEIVNELQRIAVEESRLKIPLLMGRDVIHGFKTIFPIPLGQAASWSEELVCSAAKISALEASSCGINWTFAPMIDIGRDPRWGRIAETLGEDPYLCSVLAVSMIKGFQGEQLEIPGNIAACAKHFVGYGASESGRDYASVNLPENELRNVHLAPFKMAVQAGVATVMASFSDINGVPASGNEWLMKQVLRKELGFNELLVSDFDAIRQLSVHGFTANNKEAAYESSNAGIDMEMASSTYKDHLNALIDEGRIKLNEIDQMVSRIIKLKVKLGLFENPYTNPSRFPTLANPSNLVIAKELALQSCVLLKNHNEALPLNKNELNSIAVIGPLANDGYEQLGTWIFDGEEKHSVTCLQAIREFVGESIKINYCKALENTRSNNQCQFTQAIDIAASSDCVLMILGEESILSGEAHCRSNIDLPGSQQQLIHAIAETGKKIILVVMAGRPLTLENILHNVDALLYAWHPGTMGGSAITDLLFGVKSPSGKLPVTFPRNVGQIPLYYSQKNGGRPASDESFVSIDAIESRAKQTSLGMTSTHLDTHFSPQFHFGFGLSYSQFSYKNIQLNRDKIKLGEELIVTVELFNHGKYDCEEIAQLYIRDLVGDVTRPIKELKGFQRVLLPAGTSKNISFKLATDDLSFYDRNMTFSAEAGEFYVWIGGSSETKLKANFKIL